MDEILTQIIQLAMKVNAETEKAVFVNFSGHVKSFSLRITKSKVDYDTDEYSEYFYLDEKDAMDRLAEMKTVLGGLLKEDK